MPLYENVFIARQDISGAQVDTLADNDAMIRAATRAGFAHEGTRRGGAWVDGQYVDEVILGLLRNDWHRPSIRNQRLNANSDS